MKMFLNLGRSIEGILADAIQAFGQPDEIFVLALEGDRLLAETRLPERATVLNVKKDGTVEGGDYYITQEDVCVLNGGTTPQQWAMAQLSSMGIRCKAVNLQKEEAISLAPSAGYAGVSIAQFATPRSHRSYRDPLEQQVQESAKWLAERLGLTLEEFTKTGWVS